MRATLPLLENSDFPALHRAQLRTLQVNLGYRCNLSCLHCHVSAGPKRKEEMTRQTAELLVQYMDHADLRVLDLTGGAPEMNANFRYLVDAARARDMHVIDRCNLTILFEPGQDGLAEFLADHQVEVVASLPCYTEQNVEDQRGVGVFRDSIRGLQALNALGYGREGSGLKLSLVYNPVGPSLPPPQEALQADYERELGDAHGIVFNELLTIANIPIGRFGSVLVSKGQFDGYMDLLRGAYNPSNLESVMCRSLISLDWEGYVYDCDFNQMIGLGMVRRGAHGRVHISDLLEESLEGQPIVVRNHCYGCTAGQGSSCGGALS
ncbi:MAG: arsenosugar biosynthesis radical SAM protein ArsS [Gammaproteobacteria bacterium]|nr:arsenosugar biosynthesis radical SAM protein ArsS [Gammaproteobacteria bacterium]